MAVEEVLSEVSGTVWKVETEVGARVQAGDQLLILESMKMEIPVEAPIAGEVWEIMVAEGDPVSEDQVLLTITG
jgi:biotin carboxyl carrier protein